LLVKRTREMTLKKDEFKLELIKNKKKNIKLTNRLKALEKDNEEMEEFLSKKGIHVEN
jgi:hypothetical protein